jgi:hypothetical protein
MNALKSPSVIDRDPKALEMDNSRTPEHGRMYIAFPELSI